MLAISSMKAQKKRKKKKKRKRWNERTKDRKKENKNKSLRIVGPCVCVASPRWHRLHSLFTNETIFWGGKKKWGGKKNENLNSNVYFRFELIDNTNWRRKWKFQRLARPCTAHCYAEKINKQNETKIMHKHSSRSSLTVLGGASLDFRM